MAQETSHTMSSESHLEERNDHEIFGAIEETLCSSVTLDKSELTEIDRSCHLLQDNKDTDSLESVQNYAQRIKSFLGWELNLEEQELEKGQEELKSGIVVGSPVQSSSDGSPAEDDDSTHKGENCTKNKLNYLNPVNIDKRDCKNKMDSIEKDSNLNTVLPDENTCALVQRTKEKGIDCKDETKSQQYVAPKEDNEKMDFKNNYVNNNLFDDKIDVLGNIVSYSDVGNKGLADSTKIGDLIAESDSLKSNNTFTSHEDLKIDGLLPDGDFRYRKTSKIDSDKDISDSIPQENKKIAERQVDHVDSSPVGSKEDTELSKPILTETVHYDHDYKNSKDENHKSGQDEKKSSEEESEHLRSIKMETEKFEISDLKIDAEEMNSDANESTSEVELSKKINEEINSEIISSEMITSVSEIYKKENDGTQSKEIDSSKSPENDLRNEINDTDDLRSEDSLDLYETFSFDDNMPRHYAKEIRRLSRDIVKDVIQSARSSVHELYTGKLEDLDISSSPENLRNYDCVTDTEEFFFSNGKNQEEDTSEFDSKFLKEKFQNNFKHTNEMIGEELDKEGKDTICGCSCFKPKWIQKYATPRMYLLLFTIIGVIHGCYYPYMVAILSTLEKRYAFKTKIGGTLLLADEIIPVKLGILVGYIGGKTHRPRMVALGMFLSAACCFVSGLPYLIYGMRNHTTYFDDAYKTGPKFCEGGLNSTHCNSTEQPPTLSVVGIFLFASFLKGFATLSYYVIGIPYMDDIIKRKNSPMYLAIALALRLLGPLLGYLMSSGFLKYYEDPAYDPGFGPDDPRWIGAWWIGFFLQGILLVIFTIPIALFPRRLPSQKKLEKVTSAASEGLKEIFTGLVSALKRLGKNPVFIVLIVNTTMKIFGHFGHAIMLPKYVENQFRISASEASLYSGAATILCIIISTISGGFLIWKFNPKIKVLLGGMILTETISCVGFLILMIPKCQTPEMLHFGINEGGLILDSACNLNCDCSTSTFTPFCGPDSQTLYFSPCYAGCTEEVINPVAPKVNKEFRNCSCVAEQQLGATISEGFCPDENCRSQMVAYLIVLFIMVTLSNLFTVAGTIILLRSVHPTDKSVALGTFETFTSLFGFIPYPVTFGALVDSACLVWEKSCGETGNCWFYDMEKYGYLLHGASTLFCGFSVVCLIVLYCLSSRVRDLYVDEDEEENTQYVDVKLDTVYGSVTKL